MSQLAVFHITSEASFYEMATTSEVETALSCNFPVAVGVSGGKDIAGWEMWRPQLLPAPLSRRLEQAKEAARRQEFLEAQIPDDLLLPDRVPGRLPMRSEARLLASIRHEISTLFSFPVKYLETDEIVERYKALLSGMTD